MKRGDIRVLGAASYATPLLSTAFLIMAGFAKPSASIAIAAVLIAGGGLIAAKDMSGSGRRSRHSGFALRAPRNDGLSSASILRRQFKPRKIKPRRTVHPTSVQSPVAFGRLPCSRGHDGLRHFARGEIGAEPDVRRPSSSAICNISASPA